MVLWTFAVPVAAIRVTFTEERGWYGGTDIAGTAGHLPLLEQFAAFAAGYTAENVFDCHAHDKAAHDDHGQIAALLLDKIPHQKHRALIDRANNRARVILENHRGNVLMLVDRLAECGHVDRSEFLSLMYAKA